MTNDREGPEETARPVKVFISYAHGDSAHEDRVRDFWRFLRQHGVDAQADLPAAERRQDWTEWMTRQIRDAGYVLVIASPDYKRRAEGEAVPGEGRGVQWEARLIRDRLYADQETGLRSIVPVVLPGCAAADIPSWMAPAAATHYVVREYTVAGAEKLLRLLTRQPAEIEPPLGQPPLLHPRPARLPASGPFAGAAPRHRRCPGAAYYGGTGPAAATRLGKGTILLKSGFVMAAAAVIVAVVILALPDTTLPRVPEMSLPGPGNNTSVGAVAVSPSGRILAAGYSDGLTYLWNPVSGKLIAPALRNPDGQSVYAAAFSPDGRTLAVGTANSTFSNGVIYLWNIRARALIATLYAPDHGQIVGLAFSPDSSLLAAADARDGRFYIWKAQARHQKIWKAQARHGPYSFGNPVAKTGATAVAFSPDSRLLAATDSSGDIFWWNTGTHSLITTSDDPAAPSAEGTAFNPVNATLAVADHNGHACLWHTDTQTVIKCLHGQGGQHLQDVAFTPDGKTLIATADNHRLGEHSIFVWDIATGQLTTLHDPHSTGIYALAASPRSRTLAVGDWNGHVYLWKI